MKIDADQVRHVAHLARLKLTDEEVERFAGQLSAILDYVEQLNEVDTTDVPPTAHALPIHNVLRDDVAQPSLTPDEALANAPQREGDYFALPKVLEQDHP
jgi:aspartyl-tRNA(Asn)/glutamyl-tRNA(Gln) amidotransferase subunit C